MRGGWGRAERAPSGQMYHYSKAVKHSQQPRGKSKIRLLADSTNDPSSFVVQSHGLGHCQSESRRPTADFGAVGGSSGRTGALADFACQCHTITSYRRSACPHTAVADDAAGNARPRLGCRRRGVRHRRRVCRSSELRHGPVGPVAGERRLSRRRSSQPARLAVVRAVARSSAGRGCSSPSAPATWTR